MSKGIQYQTEWLASPSDDSGVATCYVDGRKFVLELKCFLDFQAISEMIRMANIAGRKSMEAYALEAINAFADDIRRSAE